MVVREVVVVVEVMELVQLAAILDFNASWVVKLFV